MSLVRTLVTRDRLKRAQDGRAQVRLCQMPLKPLCGVPGTAKSITKIDISSGKRSRECDSPLGRCWALLHAPSAARRVEWGWGPFLLPAPPPFLLSTGPAVFWGPVLALLGN